MHTQNPFLDEIAKLTTAAAGLAQAAGEEAKAAFRAQGDRRSLREAEHWLRKMAPENRMMNGWAMMLRAQLEEAGGSPKALATATLAAEEFRTSGMERFLYMTEAYRARLIGGDEGRALMVNVSEYQVRERLDGWDSLVAAFVPCLRQR